MLEVHDLHAYYGKSHILQGVDFRVGEGEIVSLLGRNGVGRSTTIKAIMGEVERTGSVRFKGRETIGMKPHQVAHCGLGYVPDDLKIIKVAETEAGPYVLPMISTVNDKSYPIARDLYMYTAGKPAGAAKDYLDWILSNEAQEIVAELGFVPILLYNP